jgi:hypothetical protein
MGCAQTLDLHDDLGTGRCLSRGFGNVFATGTDHHTDCICPRCAQVRQHMGEH